MNSNPDTSHAVPSAEALPFSQPLLDRQAILSQDFNMPLFEPVATFAQVAQLSDALDALKREVQQKNTDKKGSASTAITRPRFQDQEIEMLPIVTHYLDSRISPQHLEKAWETDAAITLLPNMIDVEEESYFMNARFRYIIKDHFWAAHLDTILIRGCRVDIRKLQAQRHMTMCTKYTLCDVGYFVENTHYTATSKSFVRVGAYLRSGHRFSGCDSQWGDIIMVYSNEHNDAIYPDALSLLALRLTRSHMGRYKHIRQAAFRYLANQSDALKLEVEAEREYRKANGSTGP